MLARAIEALDLAIEALDRGRKARRLEALELRAQRRLSRAFIRQGALFVRKLAPSRSVKPVRLREAFPIEWLMFYVAAAVATRRSFRQTISDTLVGALLRGADDAADTLEIDLLFGLKNPRAVAYLAGRAALRVAGIEDTTRAELERILTQAVDEGWSYGTTAKTIRAKFADFSRERAKTIAITEAGDAYEAGNIAVGRDLAARGLVMEKFWLTAEDEKVDDVQCGPNEAQGWIPLAQLFQSGHDRPLAHPNCRCAILLRRAPSSPLGPRTPA